MAEAVFAPGKAPEWLEPPARAYLAHGSDAEQLDQVVSGICERVVDPEWADFDMEVLDADRVRADDVLASVQRAPMASQARLVVLRGAEALAARERRADSQRLAEGIATLPAASCLVLRVQREESGQKSEAPAPKPLIEAVGSTGWLIRCPGLDERGLCDLVVDMGASAGVQIARDAALRLVRSVHGDRAFARNEVEKLICLVGTGNRATIQHVDSVVASDPEDVMFRLVDAISSRNADAALGLLREVARYESKPHGAASRLIALLTRQLRMLWQARCIMDTGADPRNVRSMSDEMRSEFPNDGGLQAAQWRLTGIARDARLWTVAELAAAMRLLVECDAANKGDDEGSGDVLANLDVLVLKLCVRTR